MFKLIPCFITIFDEALVNELRGNPLCGLLIKSAFFDDAYESKNLKKKKEQTVLSKSFYSCSANEEPLLDSRRVCCGS